MYAKSGCLVVHTTLQIILWAISNVLYRCPSLMYHTSDDLAASCSRDLDGQSQQGAQQFFLQAAIIKVHTMHTLNAGPELHHIFEDMIGSFCSDVLHLELALLAYDIAPCVAGKKSF